MKLKIASISFALILYFIGLLFTIVVRIDVGTVLILCAFAVLLITYLSVAYTSFKEGKLFKGVFLSYTLALIVIAEVFIQSFSIAIDRSLFGLQGFYFVHLLTGFLLAALFLWQSIVWIKKVEDAKFRFWLRGGVTVSFLLTLAGLLGFAGIVPSTVQLIYYGFVFLTLFYFSFFLFQFIRKGGNEETEKRSGLIVSLMLIVFWLVRWQMPDLIPRGISSVVVQLGFLVILIIPTAVFIVRKIHFITVFILYSAVLEFYFIGYNSAFRYIVQTGGSECIGYDDAIQFPVVTDPGVSLEELFREATADEISAIVNEWEQKQFAPGGIKVEYAERRGKGDSIKVISHRVNGKKHYGLLRIPAGINLEDAPILLSLPGGGAQIDVTDSESLFRVSSGQCRDVLDHYITVIPAFRGDILRGADFCFRAEGYTGDVWLGAAEDAASLLEVVQHIYARDEQKRVMVMGISRGATVALILGGLTRNKVDYIISVSTHTDFHNIETFKNERVGRDYPAIFFTPQAPVAEIRKRMIASSPYFFAERLPRFEIHQGTDDMLTVARHAKRLQHRLQESGRSDSTFAVYLYEGKGHAYDDDEIVCQRLKNFLNE